MLTLTSSCWNILPFSPVLISLLTFKYYVFNTTWYSIIDGDFWHSTKSHSFCLIFVCTTPLIIFEWACSLMVRWPGETLLTSVKLWYSHLFLGFTICRVLSPSSHGHKIPRTDQNLPKPKYSVPCSALSFQEPKYRKEPKYRGKYRNRTVLTEFTEVNWNLISWSVIILLIVLLYTIILCNFGTHTYSHVDFYMYLYFALLLSMKSYRN
jgi:hypothetical protein